MTNPFGPSPFQPNPFGTGAPGPHPAPQPTPGPPRDEANVLATLSVVFAFVFAPAGLILGHLGLAQIRHTGQRGRERALVGVTLSYVFITALVIALIVAAMMPEAESIQAAAPTPTTTQPPPTPTVAPSAMDGLLATLDDVKNYSGDNDLTVRATYQRPTPDPARPALDRRECLAVMEESAPEAYDVTAVVGYSESVFSGTNDPHNMWDVGEGVSSFHDATAAEGQLGRLQAGWRRCGGSTVRETWPDGRTYQVTIAAPADAGNGITTIETVTDFPTPDFGARAIAAKANVVIDVGAWSTTDADRAGHAALGIIHFILNKVPG
ncbi:hypothetical protein A5753_06500 [Mycobacterium sp. 852002-51971_SCH5477799-a]|uniref:sensor domain-containing protein n=1 Tax=Mycobacterium sp. 852002-51971_SCH5477799-a TaxID=1834106 RepID=UPI0008016DDE|nr:sensor domain-containing protein [Mycobacterium sp. 852002-51971_SCH5477799-a]OBF66364.1 hypothetical protein A5753_06500 [Mycobacterium sp. 852002-51971_SCH5477799-a]